LDSEILPFFRRMGRAHRVPGSQSSLIDRAPLQRNNPAHGERKACPPGPKNEARLMVFARSAPVPGPGNTPASGPQDRFFAEMAIAKV